ncbi:MAG: hypothetical protein ACI8RA_002755 [Chlamydiales bacterium]|jgi:hypothetical protein
METMSESNEVLIQEFKEKISSFMLAATYTPLKRKQILAALSIPKEQHQPFRKALKALKSSRFLTITHGDYLLREKKEVEV